jgi:hypothetical protein
MLSRKIAFKIMSFAIVNLQQIIRVLRIISNVPQIVIVSQMNGVVTDRTTVRTVQMNLPRIAVRILFLFWSYIL